LSMRQKAFCHYCGGPLSTRRVDDRLRLFCLRCQVPIYENPVPATALVVVDPEERILLVLRNEEPKKGWWCLPGGFLELGEGPEEGALRELKEETGLSGRIEELLGLTANHSMRYDTVLMIGYLVRQTMGSLRPGGDAEDLRFFPFASMPEIAFGSHRRFVRIYHAGYRNT